MKRQIPKMPLMVSGIFIATVLAVLPVLFLQSGTLPDIGPAPAKGRPLQRAEQVPPLAGHWLKTALDAGYRPASLDISQPAQGNEQSAGPEGDTGLTGHTQAPAQAPAQTPVQTPVLTLEEASTALNRETDSLNVMYIWTDDDLLKVISVTVFNRTTGQAGIVVIPLNTVTDNGNVVNLDGDVGKRYLTVRELYREKGREGVRNFLAKKLEVEIKNYVHVNQPALQKVSNIIGDLEVSGGKTTMLESFEQTAAGIRTDDHEVVRAVAGQVLQPRMIAEIPRLLWIFTHDIRTNFTTREMIDIFYLSRQMNLQQMLKTALPGQEYRSADITHLFVSEQAWKNILYEITR